MLLDLYYVQPGITGTQAPDVKNVKDNIKKIKQVTTYQLLLDLVSITISSNVDVRNI